LKILARAQSCVGGQFHPEKTGHFDRNIHIMFTKMEKVMVHEVNKGKSCKEIANELHISDTTITKHWRNINTKTGIKTTKQACTYAAQLGILQVFMLFLSFCMDDCCLVA